MNALPLSLIALLGVLLVCGAIWLLVPAIHGLPWVPTREARIRRALQMAGLQPGEVLYDLGSGDGRVLRLAASEFGARAVGIEVGPMQCLLSRLLTWLSRSGDRVQTRCGNFYKASFQDADVVFVYLTSGQTARLRPLLERQLRPGARVVSIAADFPGWRPTEVDRVMLVFAYILPQSRTPRAGDRGVHPADPHGFS